MEKPIVDTHMVETTSLLSAVNLPPFRWRIESFSAQNAKYIESATFKSTYKSAEIEFQLFLYPNGKGKPNRGYISLYLIPVRCTERSLRVQYKFAIVKLNQKCHAYADQVRINHRNLFLFPNFIDNLFNSQEYYGATRFIARDTLLNEKNQFLIEDTLTILCEVNVQSHLSISRLFWID